MVWDAITGSSKSPLEPIPTDARNAVDFVRQIYDEVLGDYWQHHQSAEKSF
jgi:hypothetical protein